ncbi:glucokinase [Caldichromatium japonicum]|uniref:Glucokinase n=1 Tax=Caldichromatium japonicum TaxID=2699430 RepID=A0A6G7V9X7_9GAMM|nr:glucokinase [Caldichromatium japonicum]QIK36873.1 glucokinase [Caldichromatium japonicum]
MRVLVGDIGGTKTALGLAETDGGSVRLSETRRYPSRISASLEGIIQDYLHETGARCRFAALAVAGPVYDRRCEATNLPWVLDAESLEQDLGLTCVELINDLEAVAWGIPLLHTEDLFELYAGDSLSQGNACVIAAGTGLGQAGLFWDGLRHHPFASEGGHTDFAPTDDLEFAILTYLKGRFGRVSWERVVSGPGIVNLFDFFCFHHGVQVPDWLQAISKEGGDMAAAIAQAAVEERCPLCRETMNLFMRLYGREAGNTALKYMALGGVYLGGGIVLKNLECLRRGAFLEGFFDKGRMGSLMRRMPVRVILQPDISLFGAARFMALQ